MNRFQSWYSAQPRALRVLLTINVVLYVLWVLLLAHIAPVRQFVEAHLALHPALPGILLEPWQLLTYNFLHLGAGFGGLLHVGFNMLWLYWIGKDFEEMHGPQYLLAVYLITGIGGGLLSVLLFPLLPGLTGGMIYGASASVLGLMMAVAIMYPYKKIALLFIGPVRIIYLVIAVLVLDLLLFAGSNAMAAHLGGAFFGFLIVQLERKGLDLTSWARIFFRERRSPAQARRTMPVAREQRGGLLNRLEEWLASRGSSSEAPAGEPPSRRSRTSPLTRLRGTVTVEVEEEEPVNEIDRILDKISERGMESLTEEERRILQEASRR